MFKFQGDWHANTNHATQLEPESSYVDAPSYIHMPYNGNPYELKLGRAKLFNFPCANEIS